MINIPVADFRNEAEGIVGHLSYRYDHFEKGAYHVRIEDFDGNILADAGLSTDCREDAIRYAKIALQMPEAVDYSREY